MPRRLRLIPGNDLDRLADALAGDLAVLAPLLGAEAALEPLPILVPNAGVRDWLRQALAIRLGVCAGFDLLTPAAFTDRWLPLRLGLPAVPDADQRWRCFAGLADEPQLLRRYRLACVHADCLRRYRLHRPQWLRDWRSDSDDGTLQPRLWRAVIAGGDPLAAWDAMVAEVEAGTWAPPFTAAFATADLAPEILRLFAAIADHSRVHLYALQPVAGDWTDQRSRRLRLEDDGAEDHPLLGDWGTAGRSFLRRIDAVGAEWSERGAFAETSADTLLGRIRQGLGEARVPEPEAIADADDSLSFHAVHGPRRALEAAKQQLAVWFAADPTLAPHEVALLCPDADSYGPLARAIFADRADGPALPLDVPDRRGDDGLGGVLLHLLRLVPGRWEATAVLDLLGTSAIAEAWHLDGEALARIRGWCDGAGLRWGVDAEHRQAMGLPGTRIGTWRQGLARIQLTLWGGDDAAGCLAPGGPGWESALPAEQLRDGDQELAERLAELLAPLLDAAAGWRTGLRAEAWADSLTAVLGHSCPEHPDLPTIGGAISDWRQAVSAAGVLDPLPATVVAAAIEEHLADLPGAFVRGAIVLAGLRPMRALPFRVICLLGMDDGAFPRQGRPNAEDRLRSEREPGDPDPRAEDRQALLDTLLTVRDKLWIAWTGSDPRTGEELPPAPVVGDLLAHAAVVSGLDEVAARTRLVRVHRLLAAQDAPVAGPWASADLPATAAALGEHPRRSTRCGPASGVPRPNRLDLDTLIRGWLRPDRVWLRRLGVRPGWVEEPPSDDEGAAVDRDEGRYLQGLLLGVDPDAALADHESARGVLPPGPQGRLALVRIADGIKALRTRARILRPRTTRTRITASALGIDLHGEIDLLPDGPWTWSEKDDPATRVRARVTSLLAQVAGHGPGRLVTAKMRDPQILMPTEADPRAALGRLLAPWTADGPIPFTPKIAALALAGKDPGEGLTDDWSAVLVWPDPHRPWTDPAFRDWCDWWAPALTTKGTAWSEVVE